MGILDQVTQMKSMGKSDAEIIQVLQSQGIPPKDIQDSLSQAQIKNAVAGNYSAMQGMQESIIDNPPEPDTYYPQYSEQQYAPASQYTPAPQQPMEITPPIETYPLQQQDPSYQYQQAPYQQDYPQPEANYSPYQNYPQEEYPTESYAPETNDTSTIMEISEQVFTDKIKKVEENLNTIEEFKTITESKVETMEQRLKRIESTIDQLQISILDKIGSYGQNLSSIKKEMSMMQDSFSKVVDPLLDRKRR